jgi:hypothetical protein
MRAWRLIATIAAVLTAASAGACSATVDGGTTASQAPWAAATIPADPVAALAAAKARLGTESARFAQDSGSAMVGFTGVVNAETKNWEITGKEFVVRRVGNDLYVQASGKTLDFMLLPPATTERLAAGGWVHTRLPNGRELSTVFNDGFPWNLANPATSANGMTRTGSRSFAGKLIVKDSKPSSTPRPDTDLRVSVDLDEQGRFARISLDAVTKRTEQPTVFTFSDYGTKADLVAPPPPADVVEEDNPSFLSGTRLS